jgi:hypothetical protein
LCRRISSDPRPTKAHRRWWLDRFTLDEIREMAFAFWPEDGAASILLRAWEGTPPPRRAKTATLRLGGVGEQPSKVVLGCA